MFPAGHQRGAVLDGLYPEGTNPHAETCRTSRIGAVYFEGVFGDWFGSKAGRELCRLVSAAVVQKLTAIVSAAHPPGTGYTHRSAPGPEAGLDLSLQAE